MSDYFAHETAIIDDGSEIGEGTKIWHFCHVSGGSIIGKNCVLGQNIYVGGKAVIGNNVKIQNNVSVYDSVIIENDVFLGPSCVLTNVINPRSTVNRKDEYKTTIIKQGASVGANATIVCGNDVGRYAFISAGAVVTKSIPDFALAIGVPARVSGWVDESGNKLDLPISGVAETKSEATGKTYRLEENKVFIKED